MVITQPQVKIRFDIHALPDGGLEKLHKIEDLFAELGIHFDRGRDLTHRDWEWDWSLRGPVELIHNAPKTEITIGGSDNQGITKFHSGGNQSESRFGSQ